MEHTIKLHTRENGRFVVKTVATDKYFTVCPYQVGDDDLEEVEVLSVSDLYSITSFIICQANYIIRFQILDLQRKMQSILKKVILKPQFQIDSASFCFIFKCKEKYERGPYLS